MTANYTTGRLTPQRRKRNETAQPAAPGGLRPRTGSLPIHRLLARIDGKKPSQTDPRNKTGSKRKPKKLNREQSPLFFPGPPANKTKRRRRARDERAPANKQASVGLSERRIGPDRIKNEPIKQNVGEDPVVRVRPRSFAERGRKSARRRFFFAQGLAPRVFLHIIPLSSLPSGRRHGRKGSEETEALRIGPSFRASPTRDRCFGKRRRIEKFLKIFHFPLASLLGFRFNRFFVAATAGTKKKRGCLAQLVERLPYKQNVGGSTPSTPTKIAAIARW